MYIPTWFQIDEKAALHELMQQYSFAALITQTETGPFATHLPFLLDTARGPWGTLRAHLARANPQWQHFTEEMEALVLFQGPHAYISPSWYAVQPSVPTWNYAVVHAYGVPRLLEEAELLATLHGLTQQYEGGQPSPWSLDALPDDYIAKMARAIVGVEIELTRLEGKFKLSQNRSQPDQERVIAALAASADPLAQETAHWMRREVSKGERACLP